MVALFAILLVGSAVLNLPAWFFARSRNQATWWMPLLGAPPILAWVVLVALGVGAQSLSNVIEAMTLATLSVLLCYAQAFVLNRRFPAFRRTSAFLAVALIAVAVLLRLFMPLLPE